MVSTFPPITQIPNQTRIRAGMCDGLPDGQSVKKAQTAYHAVLINPAGPLFLGC